MDPIPVYSFTGMCMLAFVIAMSSWLVVSFIFFAATKKSSKIRSPIGRALRRGLVYLRKLIATAVAKITHGQAVVLLDFEDEIYVTVAYQCKDSDDLTAYTYFTTNIGKLYLHPNGKVNKAGHTYSELVSTYVLHWLPVDIYARTEMVLRDDRVVAFDV